MEDYIARRLMFLIEEASSPHPVRDMSIKMIERTISNYATIGMGSGTSFRVKRMNLWMSRAAYEAVAKCTSYKQWHDLTTNEHEIELIHAWRKLCEIRGRLSLDDAFELYASPFVTILRSENAELRRVPKSSRLDRYAKAGILVGKAEGLWSRGKPVSPLPPWSAR